MESLKDLLETHIYLLHKKYPFIKDFWDMHNIKLGSKDAGTLEDLVNFLKNRETPDSSLNLDELPEALQAHIAQMLEFLGATETKVESISIYPGTHKDGSPESFEELTIRAGEVICIVGPTGSGKSRLLADIEWVAQKDTPTGRKVLVNGAKPDSKWRFSSSDKLVAQLSQNMNFVMDLTVEEFLELHAESRMVENRQEVIEKIITEANHLAGEAFLPSTPVTSLSGGQSRALMIADTAVLSKSPIVLIDEIENAGIDRQKALSLLLSQDKIVLMATHDPILALMGDKRLVIQNGGIAKIIETSEEERSVLGAIQAMDNKIQKLRSRLRSGESLHDFEY